MKALQYISILLFLFILACNSDPSTNESKKPSEPKDSSLDLADITPESEPEPDYRIPLPLDGLYATSSAPSSDIRTIFDRDPSTIWKTKKGMGPDEGIMLYFSKPTMIRSIKIEQASGTEFSEIETYTLYGNGVPIGEVNPGEAVSINQELLNVYLRFYTSKDVQVTTQKIEDEFYNEFRIERFDKNKRVGIKNMVIEGEEGEFRIVAPNIVKGSVKASSTLNAESFAYDPSLLFDARKEFVWVEGGKGDGLGERLRFKFNEEVNLAGFQIWNGYQRSESHFNSNAKLKNFGFGITGLDLETYSLKNEQGLQKVKLKKPLKGTSFELEIQAAYKGWTYQDLAISEILFFDEADALFGIRSQKTIANQNAIKQKTKSTILEKILDSRIYNAYTSDDYPMGMDRSIILRSDGTFVIYSSEEGDVDGVSTIADGNWEILSANEELATISVFGKLLDFSMLEMYYAGKNDAEMSRIFRDKVTIKNNSIEGEKIVDEIKF